MSITYFEVFYVNCMHGFPLPPNVCILAKKLHEPWDLPAVRVVMTKQKYTQAVTVLSKGSPITVLVNTEGM